MLDEASAFNTNSYYWYSTIGNQLVQYKLIIYINLTFLIGDVYVSSQ